MHLTTVDYQVRNRVARIWLNRPETHNAQNTQMIMDLDAAMQHAAADPDVRVVVLAGRGKSFSSGHDLKRTIEGNAELELLAQRRTAEGRLEHELSVFYQKCLVIRDLPKPTIAQVHGHCIAAGMMVAAMCDLIIAADNAVFSNPVLRMGGVGVEILFEPWELGIRKAKELLFTGDTFSADEAYRLGMVNRVVPADQLDAAVDTLAERIARMPPVALRLTKMSLNKTMDMMGQRDAWDYHFMTHQLSHATDEWSRIVGDGQGKLKDFVKQRDAPFKPEGGE